MPELRGTWKQDLVLGFYSPAEVVESLMFARVPDPKP